MKWHMHLLVQRLSLHITVSRYFLPTAPLQVSFVGIDSYARFGEQVALVHRATEGMRAWAAALAWLTMREQTAIPSSA